MEGGSEIPDDEVFHSAVQVQLILLEFRKPELEEDERMIAASMVDDFEALEELLQCPRNPNVRDADWWFRNIFAPHFVLFKCLVIEK